MGSFRFGLTQPDIDGPSQELENIDRNQSNLSLDLRDQTLFAGAHVFETDFEKSQKNQPSVTQSHEYGSQMKMLSNKKDLNTTTPHNTRNSILEHARKNT